MKLLLDQNLSWRLVSGLQDLFPGIRHVREAGMDRADDVVWEHAKREGFIVLSKVRTSNSAAFSMVLRPSAYGFASATAAPMRSRIWSENMRPTYKSLRNEQARVTWSFPEMGATANQPTQRMTVPLSLHDHHWSRRWTNPNRNQTE